MTDGTQAIEILQTGGKIAVRWHTNLEKKHHEDLRYFDNTTNGLIQALTFGKDKSLAWGIKFIESWKYNQLDTKPVKVKFN